MNIPKLAKGGIVDIPSPIIGFSTTIRHKELIEPLDKKYIRIYSRTKKRRIKKKQAKKSLVLQVYQYCALNKTPKEDIKICIGGKEI